MSKYKVTDVPKSLYEIMHMIDNKIDFEKYTKIDGFTYTTIRIKNEMEKSPGWWGELVCGCYRTYGQLGERKPFYNTREELEEPALLKIFVAKTVITQSTGYSAASDGLKSCTTFSQHKKHVLEFEARIGEEIDVDRIIAAVNKSLKTFVKVSNDRRKKIIKRKILSICKEKDDET